jgi:hypothetical protein
MVTQSGSRSRVAGHAALGPDREGVALGLAAPVAAARPGYQRPTGMSRPAEPAEHPAEHPAGSDGTAAGGVVADQAEPRAAVEDLLPTS